MTIVGAVYVLCTLVAGLCGALLLRAYGRVRQGLLLWSGLCFIGLSVSNALVFVDLEIRATGSLYTWRLAAAAVAMLLLLYGLITKDD